MQLSGFDLILSHLIPPTELASQQDQLSTEDKNCYRKIVNDLLICAERVDGPSKTPSEKKVYAIIFHQSESWRHLETLFNAFELGTYDSFVTHWAQNWTQSITELRSCHNKFCDFLSQLELYSQPDNASIGTLPLKDLVISKISAARQELGILLRERRNQLDKDLVDQKLNTIAACKNVIKLLHTHWLQLVVFYEWPGICHMDERGVFAQVCRPKSKTTKDNSIHTSHELGHSTKAIFYIEETDTEEKTVNYGLVIKRIIRVKEISLKNREFGPSTPRLDNHTSDVYSHRAGITSMANKMELIVKLALLTVNDKLSKPGHLDSHLTDNDLTNLEEESTFSLSDGISRFLTSLKPFFPRYK